ncbi:MAG: hypothetical protein WD055_03110 [Candidatus Dependentiae bacterium]
MNRCWLLLFTLPLCADQPIEQIAHKQPITVQQIIFQTIVDQKTEIQTDLKELFGKKLVAYLNNLDNQTFKQVFAKLHCRAKLMYLLEVKIPDYERFIQRYTDDEWEHFWCSLTSEEQKRIPKTREEQLLFVRDAYGAYQEHLANESWLSLPEKKAPHSCDLQKFKTLYHKDPNDSHTKDKWKNRIYYRKNFMQGYLLRKKLELFNMP